MDFNRKLENILQDIREIENDAVDISNAGEISKIEMDLLMEKVRRLYDQLIQADRNYAYGQGEARQQVPVEVTRKDTADHREQGKSPVQKNHKPQRPENDDNKGPAENLSSETPAAEKTQEPEASKHEAETTWKGHGEKRTEGPEIVADKYQNARTFRHDDLAKKQPQNNLSSRMQSRPIYDLSKAIGLNDKFLFIRELFNGDKQKYHEAIQIINEMPNFEEAQAYIHERFNWDDQLPEVKKFMDLVRRKFSIVQ